MIVVDASAALLALTSAGEARTTLAEVALGAPHLIDSELASALRGQVRRSEIPESDATAALGGWSKLGVERFGARGLLPRIWELRDSVSSYDATYVALAEALECALLTADGRLARAHGPRCPVNVVRS